MDILRFIIKWLPLLISSRADIRRLIEIGRPVLAAVREAAPEAEPIIRRLAAQAFPESLESHEKSEAARELVSKAIYNPGAMTRQEEELWFARQSQAGTG